jgi:hypothetical protein
VGVDQVGGVVGSAESVEVSSELVQKVLEKVVSGEAKEVAKAIEERTRIDVMKIVRQVDEIVGNEAEEEDAEERRRSAKERFLERKRQKMNEQ